MKNISRKIKDTGADVSYQSRLDRYWRREGFYLWYKKLRSPKPALNETEDIPELYQKIISDFGFSAIEFGNWVNNENRFNFLVSAVVALSDIKKVIAFPHGNIGLNKIALAFGSRGQGNAAAHFEPANWVINLTRHPRGEEFGYGGGTGEFAHEYGHALDYYFGTYHAKNWKYRSLTFGRSIAMIPEVMPPANTMQGMACKIVMAMIWKGKPGGDKTDYYTKLEKKFGNVEYWYRHNELFARGFEQYISHKLKAKKIFNLFLTQRPKYYEFAAYMDEKLLKKVVPMYDRLISMMRSHLK